jgi:hypothetical protein
MKALFMLPVFAALCATSCDGGQGASPVGPGRKIFEDRFDGPSLAGHWKDTSGGRYAVSDGRLRVQGARNRPLWLTKKLPRDARIEFTAISRSPAVDIKVEAWGDGESFAKTASYTATSYVFILGGWNNSRSVIARMNEHGEDRKERLRPQPEPDREYRFAIERRGNELTWELDGRPFLGFHDDAPLAGLGHEHFAFNDWDSEVCFDDLVVYEL